MFWRGAPILRGGQRPRFDWIDHPLDDQEVPRASWPKTMASQVMIPLDKTVSIQPAAELWTALERWDATASISSQCWTVAAVIESWGCYRATTSSTICVSCNLWPNSAGTNGDPS